MTDEPTRGRLAVEAALIEAACDLLAELGPRATSVRDIATQAGVNHGQVHHYFGGKRGLLKEAMRQMAHRHYEAIRELSGDKVIPPPMATPDDQRYWRAVVRATIEGDMELARTEVDEGVSVSRSVLDFLTERRGFDEPPIDLKVALAEGTALQLGWMAMEPFLFLVADVKPDEEDEVRERIRYIASARPVPSD
ncbi:MAG: TetR/AcrR family transcriptional regulator [Actinomycetia bacterium]|nr:TetR/AcrR family transcriptional regulator [Actinomycetes bacterium]